MQTETRSPSISKRSPARRRLLFSVFAVVSITSVLYLKNYLHARTDFHQGEAALQNKKPRRSIRLYTRSIRWYTPGSRYVEKSIARSLKIAELSFEQGDWALALFAYQSLYNALSSIRSIYQPFMPEAVQCQHQLAILLALLPSSTARPASEREQLHQQLKQMLEHDPSPERLISGLGLLFCCACFLSICVLLWQWHALSTQQRLLLLVFLLECFGFGSALLILA
ncbi:MAG: hypothetical protein AAGJ35_10975 [Myxococcota bacterium]